MSENDGKIHTVYMRDPLKIKSQNLPYVYKKTDLYGTFQVGRSAQKSLMSFERATGHRRPAFCVI